MPVEKNHNISGKIVSDTVICVRDRESELGVETSEGHETSSWHRVMIQLYKACES